MSDIENAIRIALQAHKGQKDRERVLKYKKALEFLEEDKKYKVYVDDNSHYKDSGHRYLKGNFADCHAAVNVCKQIVDDFLTNAYDGDKSENRLWNEYAGWDEDPFIVVTDGEDTCSFSAWDYARSRIKKMVGRE